MLRWLLASAMALALPVSAACGDDAGDGPDAPIGPPLPSAIVTVQELVDESEIDAAAATDPAFAAITDGLVVAASGYLEDSDGAQVLWAEGLRDGQPVTAVRRCRDGAACAHARVRLTAGGLQWSDAADAPVEGLTVGRPVLLKNLVGFDLTNRTVLVEGALTTTRASVPLTKADLPPTDLSRRQFVALNTFGGAFGTELASLTAIAARRGGFHEVTTVDYVRPDAVAAALRGLDAMDVMVWLSQGVRQEVQGGGRAWRTVGLTTNLGVFGDATLDRDRLAAPLRGNVTGGPGLALLLASNSYGDASPGQPDSGSVWNAMRDLGCVLVGVEGHADVGALLEAGAAFLDAFLDGQTPLSAALAAGNARLAASGARLVSNQGDEATVFPRSGADIWASRPFTPSRARLTAPFTATPYCAPPGQQKQPGANTFTTAWADVTFDGAAFEGTRTLASADLDVDVLLRGVITGFAVGDRIVLEAIGDFDKNFRDFHGFAEGVVEKVTVEEDGRVLIDFKGVAHTTEYTNDRGEECVLNNPSLATTTSGPGRLELTP